MRAVPRPVKRTENWRPLGARVRFPRMKWVLALALLGGLAYAAVYVPPRTAARMAARGLRAGWDWVASLSQEEPDTPRVRPKPPSRKAQAAAPQHRATRDGIVPQPPKETLHPSDRAALDALVAEPKAARIGH